MLRTKSLAILDRPLLSAAPKHPSYATAAEVTAHETAITIPEHTAAAQSSRGPSPADKSTHRTHTTSRTSDIRYFSDTLKEDEDPRKHAIWGEVRNETLINFAGSAGVDLLRSTLAGCTGLPGAHPAFETRIKIAAFRNAVEKNNLPNMRFFVEEHFPTDAECVKLFIVYFDKFLLLAQERKCIDAINYLESLAKSVETIPIYSTDTKVTTRAQQTDTEIESRADQSKGKRRKPTPCGPCPPNCLPSCMPS